MKKKENRLSALKHKIVLSKRDTMLIRLNNKREVEFVKGLGVSVKPVVYVVEADFPIGYTIHEKTPNIVKTVYYTRRDNHKVTQYLNLSENQVRMLRSAGLSVKEFKYRVTRKPAKAHRR